MPAQKPGQQKSDENIQRRIGRRSATFGKQGEHRQLKCVSGKRDGPCCPVLRTLKRTKIVDPAGEKHIRLDDALLFSNYRFLMATLE